MKKRFFSYLREYVIFATRYLLFLFNLSLLTGLSIKTVNLWLKNLFVFSDTLAAFPEEPEFLPKSWAEKEFFAVTCFETLLFIIGGFFCYELLIRPKTFRRALLAPATILFLWTAGESLPFFFPATEKVSQINACSALNISWDKKQHKCRLIDLESQRFEQTNTPKNLKKKTDTNPSTKRNTPLPPVSDETSNKAPVPEKEAPPVIKSKTKSKSAKTPLRFLRTQASVKTNSHSNPKKRLPQPLHATAPVKQDIKPEQNKPVSKSLQAPPPVEQNTNPESTHEPATKNNPPNDTLPVKGSDINESELSHT